MERVEKLTQAYSQMPWRKQVQVLGSFLLILVFAALVAGIFLSVDAQTTSAGEDIITTQNKMAILDREIADLQARLAFLTSTAEMQKRAHELGYETMQGEQILYIFAPGYSGRLPASVNPAGVNQAALEQTTAAPSLIATETLPAEYTESLFTWCQKHILPIILPGWEATK